MSKDVTVPEENKKTIHSSFWANIFNPPTEKDELVKIMKATPLFRTLSKREISSLGGIIHNRNYLSGEYIFYQGDPGIGLYFITEGEINIVRESDNGMKVTLAIFQPGDFFGELALVDSAKRSASAIASKDSKISVIFKTDIDEFIERNPKKGIYILRGIAEITAERLRRVNEDFFKIRTENN